MFGLGSVYDWVYGWGYWGVSRIVVWLLWMKYYARQILAEEQVEHKAGEKFQIEVMRVRLWVEGEGGEDGKWEERDGERVRGLLENKGDVMWSEVLGEHYNEVNGDIVLKVDFKVDGDSYQIWYSYCDRYEYPISFPPYTDSELEEEWGGREREYRHSVLVGERNGDDITESMNKMLGPFGNMFEGRTCTYKASWFGGDLNVIDNEGNDYSFKGSERVVFRKVEEGANGEDDEDRTSDC